MDSRDITIRFVNFWKSFDKSDNFFLDIIKSQGGKPAIVGNRRSSVDLEIVSVCSNRFYISIHKVMRRILGLSNTPTLKNGLGNIGIPKRPKNVKRRIWFTGENLRIPFNVDFDAYLSFDSTNLGIKNIYTPLWMLSINWFSGKRELERVGLPSNIADLTSGRKLNAKKKYAICAFVGNPEPIRLRTIEKLDEVFGVQKFGFFYGNQIGSKYPIGLDYQFCIAYENDLYPGYVTEKIVEAYLAGTVPIYRGLFNKEAEKIFNPRAFINVLDFENDEELIHFISNMSREDYRRMYEEPLFCEIPKLDYLVDVLLKS